MYPASLRPVNDMLTSYLQASPDEADRMASLVALLSQFPEWRDRIARTNFAGHLTASGFVLNPDRSKVLLVAHRGLGMFVQPGGHVDVNDASLRDAAIREVREETGLTAFERPCDTVSQGIDVPFDIDIHYIPANAKKNEPEHWHHDFRYVFVCDDDVSTRLADEEVSDARWVAVEELAQYPTFERVGAKLSAWVRKNS